MNICIHQLFNHLLEISLAGAGCPENRKEFFLSLLADDGIMIASIDEKNELIKIKKTHRNVYKESHISQVIFAPLIQPDEETYELKHTPRSRLNTMTSVSSSQSNGVAGSVTGSPGSSGHTSVEDAYWSLSSSPNFSSVLTYSISPAMTSTVKTLAPITNAKTKKVLLPPLLWAPTPSRHRQFSKTFKDSVFTILMIARHSSTSMVTMKGPTGGEWMITKPCVCGTIPIPIWMYILSFTSR